MCTIWQHARTPFEFKGQKTQFFKRIKFIQKPVQTLGNARNFYLRQCIFRLAQTRIAQSDAALQTFPMGRRIEVDRATDKGSFAKGNEASLGVQ